MILSDLNQNSLVTTHQRGNTQADAPASSVRNEDASASILHYHAGAW